MHDEETIVHDTNTNVIDQIFAAAFQIYIYLDPIGLYGKFDI